MEELNQKINRYFPGLVVRKDLVKIVKGGAIVPSYVLEYLLGQYCATDDELSIESGIETVREILAKHYVNRSEAGLIRSNIKERGRYKVIDKISVSLNEKKDVYEAQFSNLGIKKVLVDSATVKKHPKLLVSGVWCIADLEYEYTEDKSISPWILSTIKPIQLSDFDFKAYIESRKQFSTDEWIDLLIQSLGFDPQKFGKRSKLTQLLRLIPFCERNYNLIELGPKGTGKSHIYSEFSPHGILISGGEVTVPKLFVNNSSGKLGLVGYWDCVAFDEFAGKKKKANKALVDIMKNYMANKSFSRGVETLGAEASMVFVGNTQHSVPFMLKHNDLFDELPEQFHDSAFLDRLHCYIPGWEVDIIRAEMFSSQYGFVVDYLAEILRYLRNRDFSDRYKEHFDISSDISTRDRDAIHKTFSGFMKILFPHEEATQEEIEEILRFSIEGRKRVKDQLMRIDGTYKKAHFCYFEKKTQTQKPVYTLEEKEYPDFYFKKFNVDDLDGEEQLSETGKTDDTKLKTVSKAKLPEAKHLTFEENRKGISFDLLFSPYLDGAKLITLTDSYLRAFYQIRNLMELIESLIKNKDLGTELIFNLVTVKDDVHSEKQIEYFQKIQETANLAGIVFNWNFVDPKAIHARHIITDTGWKIALDRGLDIFQHYEMNDAFALANRMQEFRPIKGFEITYLKI